MLLGEGAKGHSPLPPPLKPLPHPQLGLLALPKGQKKGFPPTYTAQEEFFNSLLVRKKSFEFRESRFYRAGRARPSLPSAATLCFQAAQVTFISNGNYHNKLCS